MTSIKKGISFAAAAVAVLTVCGALRAESFQYSAHGKRDPLVPLVGAERPAAVALDDAVSADDVRLEGIATGAQGQPVAIINGKVYKEGARAGEVSLVKIGKKSVTIKIGGKSYERFLAGEEGGKRSGQ